MTDMSRQQQTFIIKMCHLYDNNNDESIAIRDSDKERYIEFWETQKRRKLFDGKQGLHTIVDNYIDYFYSDRTYEERRKKKDNFYKKYELN